ncbi:MAG: hypothetical protein ACRC8Y_12980 [Chroococcales cyanobacterium]
MTGNKDLVGIKVRQYLRGDRCPIIFFRGDRYLPLIIVDIETEEITQWIN